MKHLDEYRQREAAAGILREIGKVSRTEANIMEICGTHTHAISRFGIREALPDHIHLVSGPGCPVCVTSAGDVNSMIDFARENPDVIVATFGDMLRVPGSTSSLGEVKAGGSDIRVLYSPLGAVDLAVKNPDRQVILYAVGFETTAPTVASTIAMAELRGLANLSVHSLHKLTPPAMRALAGSTDMEIDGFLCPGHVTAIIGADSYRFLAEEYGSPCVVAGFEPVDVLLGLLMLIVQIEAGRSEIENEYSRVVSWEGNTRARDMMGTVFEPVEAWWRGIGPIPASGLGIKKEYADYDAALRFDIERGEEEEPAGCECGSVLKGIMPPRGCPLFGKGCTPESPVGPCMVSSEGTCAAYYRYRSE